MDAMEEVEELFSVAGEAADVMQASASSTRRRRSGPPRFHFTGTTSRPAVGDDVFVKLNGGYHKAVIKKILHISQPPMYMCVHSSSSVHAGQVQAVPEHDVTPACGTYNHYKRARQQEGVGVAAHTARSEASRRGAITKKVNKQKRLAEELVVQQVWSAYCDGDQQTRTWYAPGAAPATTEACTQTCAKVFE